MTQPTATVDSTGTAVPSSSGLVNPSTQMDENSFLKLLVAQLKYQDPLSPTDNQQFMQEQAAFSTVEGIGNLQTTMKQIQAQQQLSQSVSLIGKQVDYVDDKGNAGSGVVSSVKSSDKGLTIDVGGAEVDPSWIVGVTKPPAAAPSASDTQAALEELAKLLQAEMSAPTAGDPAATGDSSTDDSTAAGSTTDPTAADATDPAATDPATTDPAASTDPAATGTSTDTSTATTGTAAGA